MTRRAFPRGGIRTRLPVTIYRRPSEFSPTDIEGLALWLDASDPGSTYTTDAGPVSAVASPLDIAGCVGWWDASDASTLRQNSNGTTAVSSDDDPVGYWADKSTSGFNVIQASSGLRPLYKTTGLNGKPSLLFDGSDDVLRVTPATSVGSAGVTVFAVFQVVTAGTYVSPPLLLGAGPNARPYDRYHAAGSNLVAIGSATSTAPTLSLRTQTTPFIHSMTVQKDGASSGVHRFQEFSNGAGQGTIDITSTYSVASQVVSIGARADSATLLNARVSEIVLYDGVLSTAQRASVESYLATKWSISGVHTPATASSDPVGYWADKSGNNRHAVQATAGSRPTISATALNGKKQLGLVSQHLRGPSTTWTGSVSLYWVGKTGQATNGAIVFGDGTVDQTDSFHAGWLNTQGVGAFGNGWGGGNAPRAESPSAWRNADIVAGVTLSSTESVARVNGATTNTVAALTGTLSQASAAQFYIGRESTNVWNNLNGSLAELLIYQPALNASQRARLERYLAAKYGITLAPAVSNADAQDWINRVYANGGSVSTATAGAVNSLCESLESSGLRDRFYRMNIFAGGNLNAALVPLYRGIAAGSGGNYLTASTGNNGESFDKTAWEATSGSTKGSLVASPTGSVTAQSVAYASSSPGMRFTLGGTWTANATGTFSVWVRRPASGGATHLRLNTNNTLAWNTGVSQKFALTTEWTRVSMTGSLSSGTSMYALIGTLDSTGTHDADCIGTVELWRPQVELGSTATAWQAVQYGNTTDTNNAFVGVGTDYAETGASGGLTGNGTSKYLLTGLTPSALPSLATGHLSVYSATGFTGSTIAALVSSLGAGFANNFSIEANRNGAGNLYGAWGEGGSFATLATSAQGSGNGHTLISRTGSTVLAAYRDGVLRNTSSTSVTPAASSVQFGVFHHSNSGAPLNIAAARLGGYSIGASMDATQAAAYYAAMQAFQTALTRNV
jgi:hypothetical protein